jgi:hypothetical protein
VRCSNKFRFCFLICSLFNLQVLLLFCDSIVGYDSGVGSLCLVVLSCICLLRG